MIFIYLLGQYVPQNINLAINYYKYAAKYNSVLAQCALGDIYSNGKYIEPDIKKALYYYKLSANNKHSIAQFKLGVLYLFE